MSLGLDRADKNQGLQVIPAGTTVELVMKIRPGNLGLEGICKRTSKGDAEGIDAEFTAKGGEYDKRKLFSFMILDGVTSGHAKAGEISRALLRAIYEATHGLDPKDESAEHMSQLANASLAELNGATFLAVLGVEAGGKRPPEQGGGNYRDKNTIEKVLRVGDQGYRKLDQPPPAPIDRPPPGPNGTPAVASTSITRPHWA